MSIKTKILLPTIICTVLTMVLILVTCYFSFSSYVDNATEKSLDKAMIVSEEFLIQHKDAAAATALSFSLNNQLQQAIQSKDHDAVLALTTALKDSSKMDYCTTTDLEGNVLARTHDAEKYGDSIADLVEISSALQGEPLVSIEPAKVIKLSIRASAPVYVGGKLIGVVSVGRRLDQNDFVDSIKASTGMEATVFLGDERISTTVVNTSGERALGTKASAEVSAKVLQGSVYKGAASILGKSAVTQYAPIKSVNGNVLGMMFVGTYTTEKNQAIFGFIIAGLVAGVLVAAGAVTASLVVTGKIVKPITAMVSAAEKMAQGNVDAHIEVHTKDEVSKLANAFNNMVDYTRVQAGVIESIAKGDISISIEPRSEQDIVGNALKELLELNNDIFYQINNAANQVATGAHQIADGAQSLAQGSTEQASTVDELSNAMHIVNDKAKSNAVLSLQAAEMGNTIHGYAQEGAGQMDKLSQAVTEINEASTNISKVIKVIEDIAFQTNILALNAAVEAARAGVHGQGFAVVADEVRDLANKSAEAAKTTGALIATSIEKAGLGADITKQTVLSLEKITEGINQSSEIIGKIALSSEESSQSIEMVHSGLSQVVQVVQQNSAMAEESAAASEEMSGQSNLLQDLVKRFKLRSGYEAAGENFVKPNPIGLPEAYYIYEDGPLF